MFDLSPPALLSTGLYVIVLMLSLSVHEYAHAWSAWKLGDDTASLQGRLTLNPLAHADFLGTILLPLMGIPFGWAKPVPVNPARFRRDVKMSTGMAITAAAGPLSNLLLATVCATIFGALARLAPETIAPGEGIRRLLLLMIQLNVTLALFNLIPLPPLDGSRIVDAMVPFRMRGAWERFSRIAPFVLLAIVFLPGGLVGRILAGPSDVVLSLLQRLVNAIV